MSCITRVRTHTHTHTHTVQQYSPVELIVVIVCLPPEVEPDQEQREGEEEDERPQELPLGNKHTGTIITFTTVSLVRYHQINIKHFGQCCVETLEYYWCIHSITFFDCK